MTVPILAHYWYPTHQELEQRNSDATARQEPLVFSPTTIL
jgi:hypothetical protein